MMISGVSLMAFGAVTFLVSVLLNIWTNDTTSLFSILTTSNEGGRINDIAATEVCEHMLPFSQHKYFKRSKSIVKYSSHQFSLLALTEKREPFVLTESITKSASDSWSTVELVSSWNNYLLNRLSILFGETFESDSASIALIRKQRNYQYQVIDPSLMMDDSLSPLIGSEVSSNQDMDLDQFLFQNSSSSSRLTSCFDADCSPPQPNVCRKHIYSANYRVLEGIYEVRKSNKATAKSSRGISKPVSWSNFIIEEPLAVEANLTVNNTPPIINVASSYWSDMATNSHVASDSNSSTGSSLDTGLMRRSVTSLQAHYSEFHRMVIQLQGQSTYYLSHPKYTKFMYIFPSNHPFHRFSQVPMEVSEQHQRENSAPERFPLFQKAKFRSITLSEGEVLYIPPYWMSRVEIVPGEGILNSSSRDLSLYPTEREFVIAKQLHAFLEVESASLEQLVLLEALHMPYPQFLVDKRNEKLNPMERMVCGQVLVMHVLSRLDGLRASEGGGSPQKFIDQLLEQRYTPNTLLRLPDSLFVDQLQHSLDCMQTHPEEHASLIQRMNYDAIVKFAKYLANCFNDPVLNPPSTSSRSKHRVDGVKLTSLYDFIEKVGLWSMQDSRSYNKQSSPLYNVVIFLQQCFKFDSMIPISEESSASSHDAEEDNWELGTSIKIVSDPNENSEIDLDSLLF